MNPYEVLSLEWFAYELGVAQTINKIIDIKYAN